MNEKERNQRIKEIKKQLKYCEERDKVCCAFGSEQEIVELERDFQKAVNEYYEKHNELPNSQQLQRLVQQNYYGTLDNTADKECGEIKTDEIVYNKLPIKNLAQLSYSIYQDDSLIESEDKANECLKYLKENLQKVYDLIEMLDDEEYFEDEKKEVSKKRNEVDLYQIGDIINFIETIKIKKV